MCSLRPTSPKRATNALSDVHVNIFELGAKGKLALLNFLANLAKPLLNLLAFGGCDESDVGQHLGVGDRAGDVVRIKAAIEAHAFRECFHPLVGRFVENTTPSLLSHESSQRPKRWATSQEHLRQHIYCKWLRKRCQRTPSRPTAGRNLRGCATGLRL